MKKQILFTLIMTIIVGGNLFSQTTQKKTVSESQTTTLITKNKVQEETKAETKALKVEKSKKNATPIKKRKHKHQCCSAHSSAFQYGSLNKRPNKNSRRDKRKASLKYKQKNDQ